ncbi:cof protein [Vibrio sp. JCM 19236]|nr:cof protein [Vibrio sp. JCM 19236]
MNTLKSTRLIASDLDGTLLRSDKRISQYSANVLDKALSQGKQVVLATGRHFLDVKSKAQVAGVSTHLISANGAQVHLASGELLFERFVSPD